MPPGQCLPTGNPSKHLGHSCQPANGSRAPRRLRSAHASSHYAPLDQAPKRRCAGTSKQFIHFHKGGPSNQQGCCPRRRLRCTHSWEPQPPARSGHKWWMRQACAHLNRKGKQCLHTHNHAYATHTRLAKSKPAQTHAPVFQTCKYATHKQAVGPGQVRSSPHSRLMYSGCPSPSPSPCCKVGHNSMRICARPHVKSDVIIIAKSLPGLKKWWGWRWDCYCCRACCCCRSAGTGNSTTRSVCVALGKAGQGAQQSNKKATGQPDRP